LTTNHNKSAGRGWSLSQSRHQATRVGYISWQILVAGFWQSVPASLMDVNSRCSSKLCVCRKLLC